MTTTTAGYSSHHHRSTATLTTELYDHASSSVPSISSSSPNITDVDMDADDDGMIDSQYPINGAINGSITFKTTDANTNNTNNNVLSTTTSNSDTTITTTTTTTTKNNNNNNKSFLSVLWRFSRPHTIIGSALAIPSLFLLAYPSTTTPTTTITISRFVGSMIYAMIPALLMNVYITGLNQVTDVDIDKVNKPNLPLACGDWSVQTGTMVVLTSLLLSTLFAIVPTNIVPYYNTPGLQVALGFSALLGTLYSVPPIRMKRFPLLAAFCIVAVRGAIINAGFYSHAQMAAFGGGFNVGAGTMESVSNGIMSVWNCLMTDRRCMLSSLYFAVFGVVIALMKDVPDVKGDDMANVRTFSVRLGPKTVYKSMHRLLTGLFWGVGIAFFKSAATAAALPSATKDVLPWTIRLGRTIVAISAMLAGAFVQKEAKPVDPENPKEVYGFYMQLWKLFYLSYLVLPLAR